jgi:hypothetical protein
MESIFLVLAVKGMKRVSLAQPMYWLWTTRAEYMSVIMKGIQVFDANGRYLDLINTNRFAYDVTITDDNTIYTINGDKMVYRYTIKK